VSRADGAAPGARSVRLLAPAKVNLGLRITGRRADGYHLLDSLFVPIDLVDEVDVTLLDAASGPRVTLRLESEVEGVPEGGANLASRAAKAFLAAAGGPERVALRLRKRVPAAAGLGGGSSDAGAVLRGLASLLPGAVAPGRLAALALGLGADVPFFLDPRPARVRGIGEIIEPLGPDRALPPFALLLAHPGVPLATAEVYRAFDAIAPTAPSALTGSGAASTMPPPFGFAGQGAAAIARLLENDLEPAAIRLCPPVARLREQLRTLGAFGVGMSGSGPTVFGVFEDADAAHEAAGSLVLAKPAWCRVASPSAGAGEPVRVLSA
jgi:4-diphosphocytidyl-2-C-methyl-D-erythritol kinase